jgi:hypothetical protein
MTLRREILRTIGSIFVLRINDLQICCGRRTSQETPHAGRGQGALWEITIQTTNSEASKNSSLGIDNTAQVLAFLINQKASNIPANPLNEKQQL